MYIFLFKNAHFGGHFEFCHGNSLMGGLMKKNNPIFGFYQNLAIEKL